MPAELIHGDADEGYGAVMDAFRRNFAERGEVGAACVVYRHGVRVVDLWGGYRDGRSRSPWREDTLVPAFSATKDRITVRQLLSHQAGLAAIDRPLDLADLANLDTVAEALAAHTKSASFPAA